MDYCLVVNNKESRKKKEKRKKRGVKRKKVEMMKKEKKEEKRVYKSKETEASLFNTMYLITNVYYSKTSSLSLTYTHTYTFFANLLIVANMIEKVSIILVCLCKVQRITLLQIYALGIVIFTL